MNKTKKYDDNILLEGGNNFWRSKKSYSTFQ